MTVQTTEILSLHFQNRTTQESVMNQSYLELWFAYQRGELSADEFMFGIEHEFLHSVEKLEAGWKAVKW
jgi:hypothetical protein